MTLHLSYGQVLAALAATVCQRSVSPSRTHSGPQAANVHQSRASRMCLWPESVQNVYAKARPDLGKSLSGAPGVGLVTPDSKRWRREVHPAR